MHAGRGVRREADRNVPVAQRFRPLWPEAIPQSAIPPRNLLKNQNGMLDSAMVESNHRRRFRFSLRRLLIILTIACVILAFAAAFPVTCLEIAGRCCLLLPTLAVCAAVSFLSSRRVLVFAYGATGAIVGWLLSPSMTGLSSPSRSWGAFVDHFTLYAIPPAIGALFLGGIAMAATYRSRKKT